MPNYLTRIGLCSTLAIAVGVGCGGAEREPPQSPETPPAAPEAPAAAEEAGTPGSATSGSAASESRFHSEVAGFSLTKPKGWHFGTVESEQQNRQRVSVGNAELDELVRKQANASLVTVSKYPEPSDKLNPSVKVILRPLGSLHGVPPKNLATVVVNGMKGAIPSFQVDGEIEDVVVSGLPGAKVRSHFTIEQVEQGTKFDVSSRTWFVPRGAYFFMIAMSGPVAGEDVSEAEFEQVLASIEIRN